ncbi:TetR/AcrR family transcriptional regulator [Nocardia sp. NPDC048505]|uniref:TetR/AcrR family transcriptional regulator n=1 Tax=unclassified Nocardia TaxID=2637762 RepID=UPI0034110DA5
MPPSQRKPRADAQRSRTAILDAAARILNDHPDAAVETIAAAANVTRQTVYAHFPSRELLLRAVVTRLTDLTVAAMDDADPDTGPAADALLRVLAAAARRAAPYPVLLQQFAALPAAPGQDHDQHAEVADRITRVLRRGQRSGEFTDDLPAPWLATVAIQLAHAAADENTGGRMTSAAADHAFTTTLLRVLAPKQKNPAR